MNDLDRKALQHNLPYKIIDKGGYLDDFYVRYINSVGVYMRQYPDRRFDVIDLRKQQTAALAA